MDIFRTCENCDAEIKWDEHIGLWLHTQGIAVLYCFPGRSEDRAIPDLTPEERRRMRRSRRLQTIQNRLEVMRKEM